MADTGAGVELKVFISYSRKVKGFAQELIVGLALTGFHPYVSWVVARRANL